MLAEACSRDGTVQERAVEELFSNAVTPGHTQETHKVLENVVSRNTGGLDHQGRRAVEVKKAIFRKHYKTTDLKTHPTLREKGRMTPKGRAERPEAKL